MLRKWIATTTAVAVASCLAGCSAGHTALTATSGAAGQPADVTLAATLAPSSLDFTTTSGAAIPQALMGSVYETLVYLDSNGDITPGLATSWDVSADGTDYVFHLREGVTFSNGEPFDAASAKFSIDRVRSSAWTNGLKSAMAPVAETEVIDPLTLRVRLAQRSSGWLWSMGTLTGAMMTPGGVADLASHPVGTGPYEVTGWAVGQSLSYRARAHYWGAAPASATVAVRYFPDSVSATNALQAGDVDVVWSMDSPELLDQLSAREDLTVSVGTTNGEFVLSMNNQVAPFDDVRVRQAVMYAVDRQAVIDTVWEGYGTDTGGTPVPPTDPWYEGTSVYNFDPARARELLTEAGFGPDNPPRVTITVPSRPYTQATAELVYSQLRDVGFDVELVTAEFPAVWLAQVLTGHDYQMSLIAHVEARDLPTLFSPDYYLGVDDPAVASALARAAAAADDEAANAAMREAVDAIMATAGADTMMNVPNIVVARDDVTGIDANVVTDRLPLASLAVAGAGAGTGAVS